MRFLCSAHHYFRSGDPFGLVRLLFFAAWADKAMREPRTIHIINATLLCHSTWSNTNHHHCIVDRHQRHNRNESLYIVYSQTNTHIRGKPQNQGGSSDETMRARLAATHCRLFELVPEDGLVCVCVCVRCTCGGCPHVCCVIILPCGVEFVVYC